MKELILVRHGDVEYPTDASGRKLLYGPDAHLSEIGNNQMKALAGKLSDTQLDSLWVSPLIRTRESASFIVALQKKRYGKEPELHIEDRLRGLILGEWVGMPIDQIETEPNGWPDFYSHPKPGQELYDKLYERVSEATAEIVASLPQQYTSAIIAHSEINRIVVYYLEHPAAPIPRNGNELPEIGQMNKGEALRIVLDDQNNVVTKERITSS